MSNNFYGGWTGFTVEGDQDAFFAGTGSVKVTNNNGSSYKAWLVINSNIDWSLVKTIRFGINTSYAGQTLAYYDKNNHWVSGSGMTQSVSNKVVTVTCNFPADTVSQVWIAAYQYIETYSSLEILDANGNSLLIGADPQPTPTDLIYFGESTCDDFYLGNDNVLKLYYGTELLKDNRIWEISNNGEDATRIRFPYTIPAASSSYQDRTVQSELNISGITLGTNATTVVDGTTLQYGTYCGYRDCTAVLANETNRLGLNYTGSSSGVQSDTYFKLNKDGTVKEIVREPEVYIGEAPAGFMVYDDVNNQITLKAGDYDSSIYENVPHTIASDTILYNTGSTTWYDSNYVYSYTLNVPGVSMGLFKKAPSGTIYTTSIKAKKGNSNNYNLKLCPSSGSNYNSGMTLTTSYQEFTTSKTSYVDGAFNTTNGDGSILAGQSMDVLLTLNTALIAGALQEGFSYQINFRKSSIPAVETKVYLTDTNDVETLFATQAGASGGGIVSEPISRADLLNVTKIRLNYTVTGYNNVQVKNYSIPVLCTIQGQKSGDYSKMVLIETATDYMDPTITTLRLGYGYNSELYENVSNGQLVSFTTQPLYEVIE